MRVNGSFIDACVKQALKFNSRIDSLNEQALASSGKRVHKNSAAGTSKILIWTSDDLKTKLANIKKREQKSKSSKIFEENSHEHFPRTCFSLVCRTVGSQRRDEDRESITNCACQLHVRRAKHLPSRRNG